MIVSMTAPQPSHRGPQPSKRSVHVRQHCELRRSVSYCAALRAAGLDHETVKQRHSKSHVRTCC